MDVFLVPLGGDRHVLYCEHADDDPVPDDGAAPSIRRRLGDTFKRAVKEGEDARRDSASGAAAPTRGRFRRWITSRLAAVVAEQRLLWRLRGETDATLVHPDDLPPEAAWSLAREALRADLDKHRVWALVDGALALLCAPIALIPGPNLPAYYFVFRAVGHFLSFRGAQRGVSAVAWRYQASAPLTELRAAGALDADQRASLVARVSGVLGLERLAPIVEGGPSRPSGAGKVE
jgi:hypothetical protein